MSTITIGKFRRSSRSTFSNFFTKSCYATFVRTKYSKRIYFRFPSYVPTFVDHRICYVRFSSLIDSTVCAFIGTLCIHKDFKIFSRIQSLANRAFPIKFGKDGYLQVGCYRAALVFFSIRRNHIRGSGRQNGEGRTATRHTSSVLDLSFRGAGMGSISPKII